ncbi:MAG TPA: hypothetical protein VHD36_05820 [Pirellulales bacterium]|nr:hypothetical protein [Pirellulales bacterium]
MKTLCRVVAVTCVCAIPASAVEKPLAFFVDLEPYGNRKLDDNQGRGFEGNSLGQLPRGKQTLGGIDFKIGPRLIQLGSKTLDTLPAHMEGIKVKQRISKLHILHATCFGGGPNEEGSEWRIDDGTEIGHYLVHYEDQSTERIPIVYGEDVCDWFYVDGEKEPAKAKVVWKGDNDFATSVDCHLRLYASTWTNPKPDRVVMRIDFVGRKDETHGAPFCLAMTADLAETDEAPAKDTKAGTARRRLGNSAAAPVIPFNGNAPPNWGRESINGSVYYIVPLR